MFEGICDAIHAELKELNEKYLDGVKITGQELEHIDMMAHALKSLATYEAMVGGYDYRRSRTSHYRDGYERRY